MQFISVEEIENDKDFSEAMFDSLTRHLGPHCLSYELEISDHSEG